jgi:16S rRNA (guanine966-N2)-methyltransferase
MRVVAGAHKGRQLVAPAGRDVRPTSDRARESLFNRLVHGGYGSGGVSPVVDAVVLDMFCGSGALGLEALSRGAARAIFIDLSRPALDCARANAATLDETGRCEFLLGEATRPPPPRQQATLVFLDPPYGSGLETPALQALATSGWLTPGAIAAVEIGRDEVFEVPPGFTELDARQTGAARIIILRFDSERA